MLDVPRWDTATPDWRRRIYLPESLILDTRTRIERGESMIPNLPFDHERADKALRNFSKLRIKDIPGGPSMGDMCAPWVFDFVYAVFGAADAFTRKQVIRFFLLLISKKNMKSTLAAGIMMTALIMNDRPDGEFTILAPTKEIANNSFKPAMGMVQLDPNLSKVFSFNSNTREIKNVVDGAMLKVVAADADTVGGIKSIVTLVDELWLFGKKASFDNVLSEAEGALASRPEGFFIFLSTQSDEPPAGAFKVILDRMRKVRDGSIIDPTHLPVIYEFPDEVVDKEAWRTDRSLWRLVNPNLGRSVDEEFIAGQIAKADSKAALNIALAKHLNIEVGMRRRADGWVGAEFWNRRANKSLTLESLLERSEVVVIAIDGGGLDDTLGLCVLGRDRGTKKRLAWFRGWVNEIALERRKQMESKVREFAAAGCMFIIGAESAGEDTRQIAALIKQVEESGLLPEKECIAVDRYGANDIYAQLISEAVGFPEEYFAQVNQGTALQGTILGTERRLSSGGIEHDGSPLMTWCVGNACVEKKGNAILVTKEASSEKIDPLMALFGAETLMNLEPEARGVAEILVL